MSKLFKLLLLTIPFLAFQGCYLECRDIDCLNEVILGFEIIDGQTQENLFFNGTYNPEDVKIIDPDTNLETGVAYTLGEGIIFVDYSYSLSNRNNYSFRINSESIFDVSFDVHRSEGKCCDSFDIRNLEFTNTDYYLNQNNYYTIIVN